MPSRIDINEVLEALYSKAQEEGIKQDRFYRRDFFSFVKSRGIASSRNAIDSLWCQIRSSPLNVYAGSNPEVVIIDCILLREHLGFSADEGDAHTHLHTRNHTDAHIDAYGTIPNHTEGAY